jgi:hypothetical protein
MSMSETPEGDPLQQLAGVTADTSETAAAAGIVAADTPEAASQEVASATAEKEALLAGITETGTTVEGGGDTEMVVLVDRYAWLGKVPGSDQTFHLTANRGDRVKLTADEAARGEALQALASPADAEQAPSEDEPPSGADSGGEDEQTTAPRRSRRS